MKYFFIGMIKMYQFLPLRSHSYCRHIPTCSEYMIEAIKIHGSFKGIYLGIKRIIKCNPKGTYGYDPVPLKEEK